MLYQKIFIKNKSIKRSTGGKRHEIYKKIKYEDVNPTISTIALNVNGLNLLQAEIHRLDLKKKHRIQLHSVYRRDFTD